MLRDDRGNVMLRALASGIVPIWRNILFNIPTDIKPNLSAAVLKPTRDRRPRRRALSTLRQGLTIGGLVNG